jgi:TATA-box binding protein (TBP) (component of TFIID and TFIIIB)
MPDLQVRNIVATGNLKMRIDLNKLAMNAPLCVKYNASRLNAAIMKMTTPNKATCLIFGNGKLVCTGTNATDKSMQSMDICARRIKMALGLWKIKMKVEDFKIQNIISTFSIGLKSTSTISTPILKINVHSNQNYSLDFHINFVRGFQPNYFGQERL